MNPLQISITTARRFILGRQGLWPGRRWRGKPGAAQALRQAEAIQMDPLNVVARSHDIALWGRVLDYRPEHLSELLYQDRQFFDYGGGLFIYPLSELPCWRIHMRRQAEAGRWAQFAAEHPDLLEEVRAQLRLHGPLGNREFSGRARVNSYRGRKDSALALYYLWISGEVMIHHRKGFDRVYEFKEKIIPPELDYEAAATVAEGFFSRKTTAFVGLARERGWTTGLADYLQRRMDRDEGRRRLEALLDQGVLAPVQVEGWKELRYALSEDLPVLAGLETGRVPDAWQPLETTTLEEMVLLAPLEIVSARGRASLLFDFDYTWEVYKPAAQRRWGYYTLPLLWGDRLVARLDPKLDRQTGTLQILGFWLENPDHAEDPAFSAALGRCLARFAAFLQAERIDLAGIQPPALRSVVEERTEHGF